MIGAAVQLPAERARLRPAPLWFDGQGVSLNWTTDPWVLGNLVPSASRPRR